MDAEKKNYYEVLEIETTATPADIENAYLRARNAYSGESVALYSLMTKDECRSILDQIEEAYSIIGFPEKRREYDRLRGFNQGVINVPNSRADVHTLDIRASDQIQYEDFGSNKMEAKVSKITAQKKFGLEFQENPEMEAKIQETKDWTGAILREVREYKNVSPDRMAEMTRVSKTHLMAIENEDLSKLPAEVYVRGFVYQYAKVLKLNADLVASSYLTHFKKLKAAK
ncbi:MAG: helix-turn-helix domain-containing protein [Bacteriovoracaceae bacterium]